MAGGGENALATDDDDDEIDDEIDDDGDESRTSGSRTTRADMIVCIRVLIRIIP